MKRAFYESLADKSSRVFEEIDTLSQAIINIRETRVNFTPDPVQIKSIRARLLHSVDLLDTLAVKETTT